MRKGFWGKLLCAALSVFVLFGTTACGNNREYFNDGDKMRIRVMVFDGGYGSEWLEKAARKFEEKHDDVIISVESDRVIGSNLYSGYAAAEYDMYFTEQVDNYLEFVKSDYLLDITDVLTRKIDGEDGSVLDKMHDLPKDFYGIKGEDGERHYYGVPYASQAEGLTYDSAMFYEYGFYFSKAFDDAIAQNPDAAISNETAFISETAKTDGNYANLVEEGGNKYYKTTGGEYLSKGPDGKYGTEDDGEPATYDDFFRLCDYMKDEKSVTPFVWVGNGSNYLSWFLTQLAADFEGYDQAALNYTFDGTAKNIISSVSDSGNITFAGDTVISNDMADKNIIYKSAGRYYALSFLERMLSNDHKYVLSDSFFGSTFDHLSAQEKFMRLSSKDNLKESNRVAFLVDGIWWENESERNEKYSAVVSDLGDNYKRENRNFKMLSLPKVNRNEVGKGTTYVDTGYMTAMILKKIDSAKAECAKQFLQFCFTEENNKVFTTSTGTVRPYEYDLSDSEYASLSSLGRSVWDKMRASDKTVVYPYSSNDFFIRKQSVINPKWSFYSRIGNVDYVNLLEIFDTQKFTAKQAFEGIYDYAVRAIGN